MDTSKLVDTSMRIHPQIAMQRQYELLASAHKELLQRMESLVTRVPAPDGNEPADGLKIKLAAAHCLISDLRETKKQHEDVIDSLSTVRIADWHSVTLMLKVAHMVQVVHALRLQEIQDRKLENSTQAKKLNATILQLEEKLAKYLKIEEEFTSLELPPGYTHESFMELMTKFNETKVSICSAESDATWMSKIHFVECFQSGQPSVGGSCPSSS